jgi:putative Holliday junction resolvase
VISVSNAREALHALDEAVAKHEAVHVVFGLPKSMSGAIGPKARETIRFVATFARTSSVPVSLWDERLTSAAAGRVFDEAGVDSRSRRGKVDAMAAQLILQGYLDAQRRRLDEERGA